MLTLSMRNISTPSACDGDDVDGDGDGDDDDVDDDGDGDNIDDDGDGDDDKRVKE